MKFALAASLIYRFCVGFSNSHQAAQLDIDATSRDMPWWYHGDTYQSGTKMRINLDGLFKVGVQT